MPSQTPSPEARLTPDCAACAALCCVGLAMDTGPRFAIDKPIGTPCPNLTGHRCKVHGTLAEAGFSGCVAFSCLGAGQRVTQELFGGQSWQDDPNILPGMIDAFCDMLRIHEALELLTQAAGLPLDAADEARRLELVAQLAPEKWTTAALQRAMHADVPGQAHAFLRSLAGKL